MALDPIWKQQLTLVTYGNEFLSQNLSFNQWLKHSIFNQHYFAFRDLNSQHLLAQHFQVWLEGLKKQGVTRISLHNSSLLLDEKNPNPNVELLPYAHFIVSHLGHSKTAWIFGKELAEWYNVDNDYEAPSTQKIQSRIETLWRYELNASHAKRVEADLLQPNWEDIQIYTDNELFDQKIAQGLTQAVPLGESYYGYSKQTPNDENQSKNSIDLPLLPNDYNASYAHETLIRLENLDQALEKKLKSPINELGEALSADEILNIRHFKQKLEDLTGKFIIKVANHYKTAHLLPTQVNSPFEESASNSAQQKRFFNDLEPRSKPVATKSGKSSVFTLILITAAICICAYYFGL